MSNEFIVQTSNKTFTKFIDANGNGVKDEGEKFATINFTNDGGKAKTFKTSGDVSLFTNTEVTNDLATRTFASSTTSLPIENGKVKLSPCNEYSVGDLANTLRNGSGNGSYASSTRTESNVTGLPSEYYTNIGKLYTPGVTRAYITDDVSGFNSSAAGLAALEAEVLFGSATKVETRTEYSNASSSSSKVTGFMLDPNSSTADGACSTGAGAGAGEELGEPDCHECEDKLSLKDKQIKELEDKLARAKCEAAGNCNDSAPVETAGKKSTTHPELTERGENSGIYTSDPSTDVPITFNKDQWLSKSVIAMYGKGFENDSDLIEALAKINNNAINNGNASDINEGAALVFPKQIEYKGKYYSMDPAARDNDKVQKDADTVRLEIGSSKSGWSAAARRDAGLSAGSVVPANKSETPAPAEKPAVVPAKPVVPAAAKDDTISALQKMTGLDLTRVTLFDKNGHKIGDNKKAKDNQPGIFKRLRNKWDGLMYLADYGYKAKKGGGLGVVAANEAVGNPEVVSKISTIGRAELQKPETQKILKDVATEVVNQKLNEADFVNGLVERALASVGQGANAAETHKLLRSALANLLEKENSQVLNGLFDKLVGDVSDPANKVKLQKLASLAADMVFEKIQKDPKVSAQVDLLIDDHIANRGNLANATLGRSKEAIAKDRKFVETQLVP